MQKVLLIILVLFLAGTIYAQIPGLRDAVHFEEWGVYLPCPPCSGIATVPIFVDNFEDLISMKLVAPRCPQRGIKFDYSQLEDKLGLLMK